MSTTLELISPIEKWPDDNIKSLAATNPQQAMASVIKKCREPLLYHALCIVKDEDKYDLVQRLYQAIRESRLFTHDFRIKHGCIASLQISALTTFVIENVCSHLRSENGNRTQRVRPNP